MLIHLLQLRTLLCQRRAICHPTRGRQVDPDALRRNNEAIVAVQQAFKELPARLKGQARKFGAAAS